MVGLVAKYQRYAEYKDSGVEWLGEIPSEWELWKLSHAYSEIGSGTTPPTDNEKWFDGEIPWVTTGELRESTILSTKKKISKKTIDQFPTLRVQLGEYLEPLILMLALQSASAPPRRPAKLPDIFG